MKLNGFYNEVSRRTDTDKTAISVAVIRPNKLIKDGVKVSVEGDEGMSATRRFGRRCDGLSLTGCR